jgi:gliding motility-associated-like protein
MNRWGTVVFETTDPLERWDGTYKGEPLPPGVYVYKVEYATKGKTVQEETGNFTLLR